MSLRVWLPLNGTLENKGISNITITNNNAIVNTSGKIGSCYYFNGTNARISCNSVSYSYPLTLCAWINGETIDDTATQYILSYNTATGGTAGHNIAFGIYQGKLSIWHGGSVSASTSVLTNGVWYHVAAVVTATGYKLYLNGTEILSRSATQSNVNSTWLTFGARSNSNTGGAGGASYYFKGFLNDIRVYDNALSAAEVKEISQGLVLHYKLDNITNGIIDSSGYGHNGTVTGNISFASNSSRYSNCIYIPSGNTDYITTSNEIGNFSSGITMNIWFKSSCTTPGSNYHEIFNIATATQNFEMAIYKSGYFRGGMLVNGTRYVDNTNNTNILDGNWHMITMTYDGTTLRRYVDAIDKKDTSISGTLTSTSCKFLFGHYGSNTSYYAKEAYLSDARIYCTALSADDILQLYHTAMKVDDHSNIHAYEFVEDEDTITINRQGQLTADEFYDLYNAKFYKTDTIATAVELIEL